MPFFEPPEDTLDPYQLELLANVFRQTWSEIVPRGYRLPQSYELRLQKEVSGRLCALATAGVMDPKTLQALTVATVRLFPRKSRQRVTGRLSSLGAVGSCLCGFYVLGETWGRESKCESHGED
jgi:hypothetical protein